MTISARQKKNKKKKKKKFSKSGEFHTVSSQISIIDYIGFFFDKNFWQKTNADFMPYYSSIQFSFKQKKKLKIFFPLVLLMLVDKYAIQSLSAKWCTE
jgi:hypothetical protein